MSKKLRNQTPVAGNPRHTKKTSLIKQLRHETSNNDHTWTMNVSNIEKIYSFDITPTSFTFMTNKPVTNDGNRKRWTYVKTTSLIRKLRNEI